MATIGSAALIMRWLRRLQRRARPSGAGAAADKSQTRSRKDPERLTRDLVDEPFYLRRYVDVAESGLRARDHFMNYGWREGRDPNPWFSCSAYLSANPDVRREQVNPFTHWLAVGRRKGRPGGRAAANRWIQVRARHEITSVAEDEGEEIAASACSVDEALGQLKRSTIHHQGPIVISVGNNDYLANTGGVEACVAYEARTLAAEGINYLYLHPLVPRQILSPSTATAVRPILNGEPMPAISTEQLATLVDGLGSQGAGPAVRLVVHGLLGHSPAALRTAAQAMKLDIDYWVHDYFAVCSSYTLMRNNVSFCAGPPLGSTSCQLCLHGEGRPGHVREVQSLLAVPEVTVLAPSEIAARTWRETPGLSEVTIEILPYGRVRESTDDVTPRPIGERPTLAFLGYPAFHKGWEVFQQLHPWALSRGDLRLVHLGADDQHLADVEFVEVRGGTNLDMTQAMLATGVDAVLIWPLWPETFSLVTYEALAAGPLVVTNRRSGNVAVAAAAADRAIFFDSVRALERSVVSGQLPRLIRQRSRRNPGRFEWTGLTPARMGTPHECELDTPAAARAP